MNRKITLLGDMGERFGAEWHGNVDSVAEAIKLIECQTAGFKPYLIAALDNGLDAAVLVGSELVEEAGDISLGSENDIIICLIPAGSGSGFGKILAAIAIAIVAFHVPVLAGAGSTGAFAVGGAVQTTLYSLAVNLAIAGVTELLTKPPKTAAEEAEGRIFSGPSNSIKQGQPIPLLYGQLLIGGAPISIDFIEGTVVSNEPSQSYDVGDAKPKVNNDGVKISGGTSVGGSVSNNDVFTTTRQAN